MLRYLIIILLPLTLFSQTEEEFDQRDFYDSYNFLGFSADGFVAYKLISVGYEGEEDWEIVELNVQNLKTDEIVYSGVYEETILDEYDIFLDDNIVFYSAESYRENSCDNDSYKRMDNTFYIENTKELNLDNQEKTLYFLNVFHDFQSDINDDCSYINNPTLYSKTHIVMGYRGGGDYLHSSKRKRIGVLNSEECFDEFSYTGYYKSPFEMRIVLVFASSQIQNSYDSSTNYKFVGCSLNPSTFIE